MSVVRVVAFLFVASVAFAQPPSVSLFPRALKDSLGLSDAQVGAINQLNDTYYQFSAEKQNRIGQVRADIADKTAADPLDPMALGMRYAEIEAINRDLRDKLNALRGDVAKVLTPAQQPRLRALVDAQALQPIVTLAECANLLTPLQQVGNPFPGNIIPANRIEPILSVIAVRPLSGCNLIFDPVTDGPGLIGLSSALRDFLGLTRPQEASIAALNGAYLRFSFEKQRRVAQVQTDIATLTAADPLDPVALGLRYAEIEAINRDLRDKQNGLRSDIGKVLTDLQKVKVKALETARLQTPVINAALCENLLAPPVSPWFDTSIGPVIRTGDFSQTLPAFPARYCGN